MKICTKCNLLLEASYFVKDKTKSDGLYSSCKDCYRIRTGSKKRRPPWSIDSCGYRFYKKERLHRKIMEDKLGRKLSTNEHVHHINHNKLDNRLENLQLIDKIEHHKLHYNTRKIDEKGRFKKNE